MSSVTFGIAIAGFQWMYVARAAATMAANVSSAALLAARAILASEGPFAPGSSAGSIQSTTTLVPLGAIDIALTPESIMYPYVPSDALVQYLGPKLVSQVGLPDDRDVRRM